MSEVNTQMCAIMHFFVTHIRNNYNTTQKKNKENDEVHHHGICSSSFICVNLFFFPLCDMDDIAKLIFIFLTYACTYIHITNEIMMRKVTVLMCVMIIIIKYISPHLYMHVRIYLCMGKGGAATYSHTLPLL